MGGDNIHPDYLLPKLTSRQLAGWQVYCDRHPFGQQIDTFMLARLTAMLHNRWLAKGKTPVGVEDMIPNHKKQQTPEEMKLALRRAIRGNR